MNILIVNDSKLLREVLKTMLENLGYTSVYEATNGVEAIEKTHALKPEIIFMNLIMPKMDGYEASKKILGTYASIKIIIMSTSNFSDTPLSKSNLNIYDYVCIPFNKSRIKSILNEKD